MIAYPAGLNYFGLYTSKLFAVECSFMRTIFSQKPCLVFLLIMAGGLSAQADEPLRYRLGDEKTPPALFTLQIQADEGETIETHTGRVEIKVLGLANQGTRISMSDPALVHSSRPKPRADGRPTFVIPGPPRTAFGPRGLFAAHEITLDERGNTVTERGGDTLPYALGTVASWIFEPFPEMPSDQWKRSERTSITFTENKFPFPGRVMPPPPPFGIPGRRGMETEGERLNAEESITVSLQKGDLKNPGKVNLRKDYSLKTFEKGPDGPRLELNLTGKYLLDLSSGLPIDCSLEGTLVSRKANTTVKTPLKLTLHRLTETEIKAEKEARAKSAEAAKMAAEKLKAPLTAEERAEILAALQAGDKTKTPGMLQKLEQKTPTKPDAEIASALGNLLGSDKGFTKSSAARALEKWATADQVELLAAQLDEKDVFVAPPCMKALGRLKASQYAHQIAAKLGEISLRASAKEALVLMGSVAEEAVIPMIENPDQFTRGEVCEVLGAIGTESSLPALRYRAEKDESFLVKSKAKAAMEKIAKKTGEK